MVECVPPFPFRPAINYVACCFLSSSIIKINSGTTTVSLHLISLILVPMKGGGEGMSREPLMTHGSHAFPHLGSHFILVAMSSQARQILPLPLTSSLQSGNFLTSSPYSELSLLPKPSISSPDPLSSPQALYLLPRPSISSPGPLSPPQALYLLPRPSISSLGPLSPP